MAGKRKSTASVEPKLGALRIQTSIYGLTIPVVFGRNRLPLNLLWYGDFRAIKHTETTETGKGGGGSPSRIYYTYSASVVMGLAEGPITGVRTIWRGKERFDGTPTTTVRQSRADVFTVPSGPPYTVTVPSAAEWIDDVQVRVRQFQGDNGTVATALVRGVHYTVTAGAYVFDAAWRGSEVEIAWLASVTAPATSALGQLGFTLRNGTPGQPIWSHLTSDHASEAIGYSGIAYVYAQDYALSNAAEVENHNFEVDGALQFSDAYPDCDPSRVIREALINTQYGIGFPAAYLSSDTAYSTYARAAGLMISPVFNEQRAIREWITEILEATNTDPAWNGRELKFLPRGDQSISSAIYGATYTPNTTPVANLGIDDFIVDAAGDAIEIERLATADMHNVVRAEYCNRSNAYNQEPVEAADEDGIMVRGRRPEATQSWLFFADGQAVRSALQMRVQRKRAVRARYRFRLPFRFIELELGDLVTLTDSRHEMELVPARITSIEEGDDDVFMLEAEDFPIGHADAPLIAAQIGSGFAHNYNVAPGNVAPPAFVEDPESQRDVGIRILVAVSGQAGFDSRYWGGCDIYASLDGGSSYKLVGRAEQGARYGSVRTGFGAGNVSAPINLAGRGGTLFPVSATEADALATLTFIGSNGVGEFVAFQGATLDAENQYTLSGLRRGRLGTTDAAHAAGEDVIYIDSAIVRSDPLPVEMIGKTVKFKFCSFNVYGGGQQALESVAEYSYTVTGRTYAPEPPASLSGANEKFGLRLTVGRSPSADVARYVVRAGASWETGTEVAEFDSTSFLWKPQLIGSVTFWAVAEDSWGNRSTPISTTVDVAGGFVPGLAVSVDGDSALLVWEPTVAAYEVSDYEIRVGADYGASALLGYSKTTFDRRRVTGLGTIRYWVAARDINGNLGTASSVDLLVSAPATPIITSEVVDNFVLLRWQDCATTLPVLRYEVYKDGVLKGDNGDGRFAVLFEQSAGDYSYSVKAYDSAGNVSASGAITVRVSAPPDYVLRDSFDSTLAGTLTNGYLLDGRLLMPMYVETDAAHTTRIGVSTDAAAASAGYDKWWEPGHTTASYVETFDLTLTTDPSTITVTPTTEVIQGAPSVAYEIKCSTTGAFAGEEQTYSGSQVYAGAAFRYVRVTLTVTGSGGDDLLAIAALNVKVATKLKTETGIVTVSANPTTVTTSGAIQKILGIALTPAGSAGRIAVYDYTSGTDFDVYLFDHAGVAATGDVAWTIRGV